MLFQHLRRVVRPFALPHGHESRSLRRQIQSSDAGEQAEMRHHGQYLVSSVISHVFLNV